MGPVWIWVTGLPFCSSAKVTPSSRRALGPSGKGDQRWGAEYGRCRPYPALPPASEWARTCDSVTASHFALRNAPRNRERRLMLSRSLLYNDNNQQQSRRMGQLKNGVCPRSFHTLFRRDPISGRVGTTPPSLAQCGGGKPRDKQPHSCWLRSFCPLRPAVHQPQRCIRERVLVVTVRRCLSVKYPPRSYCALTSRPPLLGCTRSERPEPEVEAGPGYMGRYLLFQPAGLCGWRTPPYQARLLPPTSGSQGMLGRVLPSQYPSLATSARALGQPSSPHMARTQPARCPQQRAAASVLVAGPLSPIFFYFIFIFLATCLSSRASIAFVYSSPTVLVCRGAVLDSGPQSCPSFLLPTSSAATHLALHCSLLDRWPIFFTLRVLSSGGLSE
jgi:hypothetical protein